MNFPVPIDCRVLGRKPQIRFWYPLQLNRDELMRCKCDYSFSPPLGFHRSLAELVACYLVDQPGKLRENYELICVELVWIRFNRFKWLLKLKSLTLMFRPPIIAPFICSSASCAPSGISYSTNANPLCFCVIGSHDMLMDLIGPNGKKAARIVSSFNSNEMLPT